MKLQGKEVNLRPIEENDFCKLVEWTNDPEVSKFSEGDYPKTIAECQQWFKRAQSNRYQERFAIVKNDQIIGDLELDHITWRSGDAELRIRIGQKDLWDHGYGTDAVRALLHYAFLTLNLSRVYLRVYADNHRAIRCYQKAAFKKEGRLRRSKSQEDFREIILMRVLKDEFIRRHNLLENVS